MEKQKQQKIILLALLAIFVLSLGYRLIQKAKQGSVAAKPVDVAQQKDESIPLEIKDENIDIPTIEYNGGSFTDPLKNKLSVYLATNAPAAEDMSLINPPSLKITGLIWNSQRPQAIINGSVVSVGEQIAGCKLLSVERDGVKIEYQGHEFFIKK